MKSFPATLLVISLAAAPLVGHGREARPAPPGRQQADKGAVIAELDYLIEHVEALAARYRGDNTPVRFNYPALLEQLRLTRAASAQYLNEAHAVVHAAPPRPANATLIQRR